MSSIFKISKLDETIPDDVNYLQFNYRFKNNTPMQVRFLKIIAPIFNKIKNYSLSNSKIFYNFENQYWEKILLQVFKDKNYCKVDPIFLIFFVYLF